MTKRSWQIPSILLTLVLTLAGCGGGGGGGTSSTPAGGNGTPPAPEVAELNFSVKPLAGAIPGGFSAGLSLNDSGQAVGLVDSGSAMNGARWSVGDAAPSATILEPLPGAGNDYSASYAINADGISVGESAQSGTTVAVYWPAGSTAPAALDVSSLLPGAASVAYSINSFGEIAGEAVNDAAGNTRAVYWRDSASLPVLLDNLTTAADAFGSAYAISDAGILAGESLNVDGTRVAVVWRPAAGGGFESPIELPLPAGQVTATALTIDASGLVGGESEEADGTVHGIVWLLDAQGTAEIKHDFGAGTSVAALCDDLDIAAGTSASGSGSDQVKLWDSSDPADSQNPLPGFSRAYGINDAAQIVGLSGLQGFVAIPE